jgi:glycine C-acetyltransferase
MTSIALSKSAAHFAKVSGRNLLTRTEAFAEWRTRRLAADVWPFSRVLQAAPGPTTILRDETGRELAGINFGSHDYLALSGHPQVREAAARALRDYGPHVSCSPILQGNTQLSIDLERALGEWLGLDQVLLFPTGWAAGFGVITALVRPEDHIVLDRLAHASLQQGAQAATRNIHLHRHLDVGHAEAVLREIRAKDATNAILLVSEGLFSMDSDTPDLAALQRICRAYDATLLVDVAHDLGATGPGGTGMLGTQGVLDDVDLIVGSGSKSFACNAGFVATRSPAVKQYIKAYGGPHLFSSGLSPINAAVFLEAIRISIGVEGDTRRARAYEVATTLRVRCEQQGLMCYGVPSPIVAVPIGSEKLARLAAGALFRHGVFAHLVEFPAVPVGASRFRLLAMADHTDGHAHFAADRVVAAIGEARISLAMLDADSAPPVQRA